MKNKQQMAIRLKKEKINELFSSVVFLYDKNNKPRGSGFFFFFNFEELKAHIVYLITAKHNILKSIQDQGFMSVCMTTYPKLNGICKSENWHLDDNTDLAICTYNDIPILTRDGRDISRKCAFNKNDLATKDDENIVECADTLSIGLFSNYYGEKTRERPILRFGNIAMIPEDKISIPLPTENGGRELKDVEAYLIEQKSIGGMSGSVVLGSSNALRGKVKIIGIIHGHYDLNDRSQNDYENPTEEQQCKNIKTDCENIYSKCHKIEQQMQETYERMKSINSGISIVIPSYKILELLEREDVRKEREEAKKRYLASLRDLS